MQKYLVKLTVLLRRHTLYPSHHSFLHNLCDTLLHLPNTFCKNLRYYSLTSLALFALLSFSPFFRFFNLKKTAFPDSLLFCYLINLLLYFFIFCQKHLVPQIQNLKGTTPLWLKYSQLNLQSIMESFSHSFVL